MSTDGQVERERLVRRLFVALTEQRVIDGQMYGEFPYAPITMDDARAALEDADQHVQVVTLRLDGRHAHLPEFLRFAATQSDDFNATLLREMADQIERGTS